MATQLLGPDIAAIRAELRSWIAGNWSPTLSLLDWRSRLRDSGWAYPSWPASCGGRSLPEHVAPIVTEELARAGAVGAANGAAVQVAAATIYECGNDDQRERFVGPTLTGEITWCQLFSEPGAGSDLASLAAAAERVGDTWRISGQKVWNTSAAHADYGLLLARTDWDVPKHRGITFFVLPMHQPGVLVRPLRQMNGHATFNEVFLDNAIVPMSNVVGEINQGWAVALNTLSHERRVGGPTVPSGLPEPGSSRAAREAAEEQITAAERYKWYPQRSGRVDLVIERARAMRCNDDPVVRQEIASLLELSWSARWTRERAESARALGRDPGPESTVGKLANSRVARAAAQVHALIAGSSGMLAGTDEASGGVISEVLLSVPAISIAGGTDQIQRNVLGERVLGLPKEPDSSRDIAFRDVPRTA
jgi:alkylation response protein AidB-like acyl-CoA dehydrogenase